MLAIKNDILIKSVCNSTLTEIASADITESTLNMRFIVVYIPNSNDIDYLRKIFNELGGLVKTCKSFVILGDFNFRKYDWANSQYPKSKQYELFSEFLHKCSVTLLISFNTRENNLIDLILTNCPDALKDIQPAPPLGSSDHILIFSLLSISCSLSRKPKRTFYSDFKNAQYQLISEFIQNRLQPIYEIESCSEKYVYFMELMRSAICGVVSICKTITRNNITIPFKCIKYYKKFRRSYYKWLRTNNKLYFKKYKYYKKLYRFFARNAKIKQENGIFLSKKQTAFLLLCKQNIELFGS